MQQSTEPEPSQRHMLHTHLHKYFSEYSRMSFNLPCGPLLPSLPPALSASLFPSSHFFPPLFLHIFSFHHPIDSWFPPKRRTEKSVSSVPPFFPFLFSPSAIYAKGVKAGGRGFFLPENRTEGILFWDKGRRKRDRRVKERVGWVSREKVVGGWEGWGRRGGSGGVMWQKCQRHR